LESRVTFEFDAHEVGTIIIVKFSGRLTIGRVDELDVFLKELVKKPQSKYVLDFTELTHIVSSGIGALIAFRERVVRAEGKLAIGGLHPRILKIFKLMSLDAFFPILDSVDQAFQSLDPED
jgi:anti-anti-sigma factor